MSIEEKADQDIFDKFFSEQFKPVAYGIITVSSLILSGYVIGWICS